MAMTSPGSAMLIHRRPPGGRRPLPPSGTGYSLLNMTLGIASGDPRGHCCIEPKGVLARAQNSKSGSTIPGRTTTNLGIRACRGASGQADETSSGGPIASMQQCPAFFDCALRASRPSQAMICRKIRYSSRTAATDDRAQRPLARDAAGHRHGWPVRHPQGLRPAQPLDQKCCPHQPQGGPPPLGLRSHHQLHNRLGTVTQSSGAKTAPITWNETLLHAY